MGNPYTLTAGDIESIFACDGESHARFCIGQTETQLGSDYTAPLKALLDRLVAAAYDDAKTDEEI